MPETIPPAPVLRGEHLLLRPIEDADTEAVVSWRNAPHVQASLYGQTKLTAAMHRNWLETQVRAGRCLQFIIEPHGEAPVGTTFLKSITPEHRRAEFGIFIGEQRALGKGYGLEATTLLVRHGFAVLGLNKIWLSVFATNLAAIRCYSAAGFSKAGLLRQEYRRNGVFLDVALMELLAEECMAKTGDSSCA